MSNLSEELEACFHNGRSTVRLTMGGQSREAGLTTGDALMEIIREDDNTVQQMRYPFFR